MSTTTWRAAPKLTRYHLYRILVQDPHTNYSTTTLGYLGQTSRLPLARLIEHLYGQVWADTVVAFIVDERTYPDEDTVLAAEKAAIEAEQPLYNIEHNQNNLRRIPPWTAKEQAAARGRTARPAPHRRRTQPTNPSSRSPLSWIRRWWQHNRWSIITWASAWIALFAFAWWAGAETWSGWNEPRNAAIYASAALGVIVWWRVKRPRRRRRR